MGKSEKVWDKLSKNYNTRANKEKTFNKNFESWLVEAYEKQNNKLAYAK